MAKPGLKLNANRYVPITDYNFISNPSNLYFYARPAGGYDVNLTGYLTFLPEFFVTYSHFEWSSQGDKIDISGRLYETSSPMYNYYSALPYRASGSKTSVTWNPIPLIGGSVSINHTNNDSYREIEGKVNVTFRMDKSLTEQLKNIKPKTDPLTLRMNFDFVERNKRMVMAVKDDRPVVHLRWDDADAQAGLVIYDPTTMTGNTLTRTASITTTFPPTYTPSAIEYGLVDPKNPVATVNSKTAKVDIIEPGYTKIKASYPSDTYYTGETIEYKLRSMGISQLDIPTCKYENFVTGTVDPCFDLSPPVLGGYRVPAGVNFALSVKKLTTSKGNVYFDLDPSVPASVATLSKQGKGFAATTTAMIGSGTIDYLVTQDTTDLFYGYSATYPFQIDLIPLTIQWDDADAQSGKVVFNFTPTNTILTRTASAIGPLPPCYVPAIQYSLEDPTLTFLSINDKTGKINVTGPGIAKINAQHTISDGVTDVSNRIEYELEIKDAHKIPRLVWEDINLPLGLPPSDPKSYIGNPSPELFCLPITRTLNLKTIATSNSTGKITYSSSDTTIATIDSDLAEIALQYKFGTTTITADQAATGGFAAASISYQLKVIEYDKIELQLTPDNSKVWIPSSPLRLDGNFVVTFKGGEYDITPDYTNVSVVLNRSDFPADIMNMDHDSASDFYYLVPIKGTPGITTVISGNLSFSKWVLSTNVNVTTALIDYYTLKLNVILSDIRELIPSISTKARIEISPTITPPNRPTGDVDLEYNIIQKYETTTAETIIDGPINVATNKIVYRFDYTTPIDIISPDTSARINQLYLEAAVVGTTVKERSDPNDVLQAYFTIDPTETTSDYQVFVPPVDPSLDFHTYIWSVVVKDTSLNISKYQHVADKWKIKIYCTYHPSTGPDVNCSIGTIIQVSYDYMLYTKTIANAAGSIIFNQSNKNVFKRQDEVNIGKKDHLTKNQGYFHGAVQYNEGAYILVVDTPQWNHRCNATTCPSELAKQ